MSGRLLEIFEDKELIFKIQKRLPHLFQLAEIESSRAGKIGMEVGSLRERIITALLIYKFGEENVETNISITEPEVDVRLFGDAISIKTITGKSLSGIKLIWTVGTEKAREFYKNYYPSCDILLVQINWNNKGGLYYIPVEVQRESIENLGRDRYIKLPKIGTNPRGVEVTKEALIVLLGDSRTRSVPIHWKREQILSNPYKRWVELWQED